MRYKIIGDSCLDLTKEMRKDPCYSMIPLTLMVGERHFVDDETFDQKEFIKVVKEYYRSARNRPVRLRRCSRRRTAARKRTCL